MGMKMLFECVSHNDRLDRAGREIKEPIREFHAGCSEVKWLESERIVVIPDKEDLLRSTLRRLARNGRASLCF